jgi:glucan 1,3-beta-glucosidase
MVVDTPIFLRSSKPSNGTLIGSLVLQNIHLLRSRTAVGVVNAPDLVPANPEGEMCIERWGQGNIYMGADGEGTFVQGPLPGSQVAPCLLDRHGKIVSRSRPQYGLCSVEQLVSARAEGAVGDGVTVSYHLCCVFTKLLMVLQDDTAALQSVLDKVATPDCRSCPREQD